VATVVSSADRRFQSSADECEVIFCGRDYIVNKSFIKKGFRCYALSPALQQNRAAYMNNKSVQKQHRAQMYRSRAGKKNRYKQRQSVPLTGPWRPGYHHHHHGYDSWSDDSWSDDDYRSDDDGYSNNTEKNEDYYDYQDVKNVEVGEADMPDEPPTDVPELDEEAFQGGDEGGGDLGGDDDGGGDDFGGNDLNTVEAYASAGPQRWWKDGGGGSGSAAVRVAPPRRGRSGGKFQDWLERTWWGMSQQAFNEAILGRANPETLPLKTEVFRCNVSELAPDAITLVTQCSVDRLPQFEAQAQAWDGPISVAIFVQSPDTDLPSIADLHTRLVESTSCAMEITLVHALPEDDEAAFSEYERLYPINALRNIAVGHARSDLLFLLDVDFVPCRKLGELCKAQLWTKDVARQAAAGGLTVIPAFEAGLRIGLASTLWGWPVWG
jgi:glycosyltransferase-like protein LARGE